MAQTRLYADGEKHGTDQTYELSLDPFYSESNVRYLEMKMEDYKTGQLKLAEHELTEV